MGYKCPKPIGKDYSCSVNGLLQGSFENQLGTKQNYCCFRISSFSVSQKINVRVITQLIIAAKTESYTLSIVITANNLVCRPETLFLKSVNTSQLLSWIYLIQNSSKIQKSFLYKIYVTRRFDIILTHFQVLNKGITILKMMSR